MDEMGIIALLAGLFAIGYKTLIVKWLIDGEITSDLSPTRRVTQILLRHPEKASQYTWAYSRTRIRIRKFQKRLKELVTFSGF